MINTSTPKFIIALAATLLVVGAQPALAADYSSGTLEDDINKELLDSELSPAPDDLPPPAEYPYPGAKEEGITPEDAPKTAKASITPQTPPLAPNTEIERPKSINEDTGEYQYDTKSEALTAPNNAGGEAPRKVLDNGEYVYDTNITPNEYIGRPGQEKPMEIRANGEYKYATEQSEQTGAASFRVGFFGPPMITNESTNPHTTFADVYTKDQLPVIFLDYEVPLTKKLGQLGVKIGSGLFIASGKGKFATVDENRRADDIPLEKYTFLMFPNTATAVYRFQYKDGQTIVPYVEGGNYYTFAEIRDDNSSPKIGGALTTVVAAGLNVLVDWIDPQAIRNLDADYGINHVYLSLEARQIVGLNKSYDFTSSILNAGFVMQF